MAVLETQKVTQTVFVVDDNQGMRDSVRLFLGCAALKVETFESAEAFLDSYCQTKSGCLILDLRMPQMSGLQLQESLLSKNMNLPIIFVSGNASIRDAVKAMKAGSFEFIEKPYDPEFLLKRVKEALLCDLRLRNEKASRAERENRFNQLTLREKQVLALVVSGKPSKAIAHQIGLSTSTVDNHRARIMKKLKAETSADLARIALSVNPNLDLHFSQVVDELPIPSN